MITCASDPVVSPDSLVGFFDGWPTAPSPDVHAELLRRSDLVEVAFDGDRVIGLLARLSDLYMVDVVCDDDVAPFYARLGFTRAAGMMRRSHSAQGGSL